jgi:peptidoglycan/LPS O-acetylase OafA/YrhL
MDRFAARTGTRQRTVRRVAVLMAVQAVTLGVASTLHLTGHVHGRSAPFNADHAGIAEAIIGVLLAAGAVAMVRFPARGRAIGLVLNGFAIVGFLNGLSMTAEGGDAPDIAYHLVLLPLLIASIVVLLGAKPGPPSPERWVTTPTEESSR